MTSPQCCEVHQRDPLTSSAVPKRTSSVRRDLKYVSDDDGSWRAQEKGIDVALAIGVVEGAMNGEVDVVVIFSNDTDQLPTLELVFHGPE